MIYTLTTGQWPVLKCGRCNTTITGPRWFDWGLAHLNAHRKESNDGTS